MMSNIGSALCLPILLILALRLELTLVPYLHYMLSSVPSPGGYDVFQVLFVPSMGMSLTSSLREGKPHGATVRSRRYPDSNKTGWNYLNITTAFPSFYLPSLKHSLLPLSPSASFPRFS